MAEAGASTPLATGALLDIGVCAAEVEGLAVHMPRQAMALMRMGPTVLVRTRQASHVGETVKVTCPRASRLSPAD
jgi:hypothetical protein